MSDPSAGQPASDALPVDPPIDEPVNEASADGSVVAAEPVRPRFGRTRAVLSAIVGVIAVIALLVTVVGIWVRAVATDSDRIATAAEDALREPEVNQALALYVNDQLYEVVDVDALLSNVLPDALGPVALAPVASGIEAALRSRTLGGLEDLLAKDEVIDLVGDLVRRSYGAFVDLLQGDGLVDGITVEGGQVTLNLLPVLGRGLGLVQQAGLFENTTFPELTRDGDPAQQIASLEAFTGRDLPDDFGQLVVYQSDNVARASEVLSSAQRLVVVARRALALIAVITIVAFAGSILLANRRRRAAITLLLGSAAVLVLARVIVRRVVAEVPSAASTAGGKAAVGSILHSLTTSLMRLTAALVLAAIVVALVLHFTGPSASARRLRERAGGKGASFLDVVVAHRAASAVAIGALLLVNFMLLDINLISILIGMVLLLLLGAALWAPAPDTVEHPSAEVTP